MTQLRIVTYNIRHCRGLDNRVDIGRVAAHLASLDADMICLQEVDSLNPRSFLMRQTQRLATATGMQGFYRSNFRVGPLGGMGNAILTRGAQYSTWNKFLPSTGERRGLLHVAVRRDEATIHLFCTHWGLNEACRRMQAESTAKSILDEVAQRPGVVIVCGDLNALPGSAEVDELCSLVGLVDAGANSGPTFCAPAPTARIDYVLCRGQVQAIRTAVVPSDASDHLPLMVDVEF